MSADPAPSVPTTGQSAAADAEKPAAVACPTWAESTVARARKARADAPEGQMLVMVVPTGMLTGTESTFLEQVGFVPAPRLGVDTAKLEVEMEAMELSLNGHEWWGLTDKSYAALMPAFAVPLDPDRLFHYVPDLGLPAASDAVWFSVNPGLVLEAVSQIEAARASSVWWRCTRLTVCLDLDIYVCPSN